MSFQDEIQYESRRDGKIYETQDRGRCLWRLLWLLHGVCYCILRTYYRLLWPPNFSDIHESPFNYNDTYVLLSVDPRIKMHQTWTATQFLISVRSDKNQIAEWLEIDLWKTSGSAFLNIIYWELGPHFSLVQHQAIEVLNVLMVR